MSSQEPPRRLLHVSTLFAVLAAAAAGCPAPPMVESPSARVDGGAEGGPAKDAGAANDPAVRLAQLHAKACEADSSGYPAVVAAFHAAHPHLSKSPDPAAVVAEDMKLCDSGESCLRLADDYDKGFGVPKNAARAVALYKADCEQTRGFSPMACWRYADRLATGKGVPRNARRAVELYENVCVNGMYGSCLTLADMVRTGDGAKPDETHAFQVEGVFTGMVESCCYDNTDRGCCVAAAAGYREGRGREKDASRAQELERDAAMMGWEACAQGIPKECYELGQHYALGRGVPSDPACARKLFDQACAGGYTPACKPPTPSAPPGETAWTAEPEVIVKGSSSLGCVTKMVREWLRVRCVTKDPTDAPVDLRVVDGGDPLKTFAERGKGEVTLLSALRPGTETAVRVVWPKTGIRTLLIRWPQAAASPTMEFDRGR